MDDHSHDDTAKPSAEVVATLVANHRAFLSFVQHRVSSRDLAEEILQNAFVKNVEKFDTVRETAVGWFYKVLRNAIIDHHRRKAVADKAVDGYATEVAMHEPDQELHNAVCKCVAELASTLKPEYAEALCGTCADHGCLDCTCGTKTDGHGCSNH